MSVILLVHLSDSHLKAMQDPLMRRASILAKAIVGEIDASVTACVIAFTGDAIDKGGACGFSVAKEFLINLVNEIEQFTRIRPTLLLIPGNHDLVLPADTSLRDVAIESLVGMPTLTRPKKSLEDAILAPLSEYFTFAAEIAPDSSPSKDRPFYVTVDKDFDGKRIRFHLINSSWMCMKGQSPGSLLFPVDEIHPPDGAAPAYEITLLHHPFSWFKQPEAMRPLRDTVEAISDMILTGHEHVGRSMTTTVHGGTDHVYHEGEPLQDGDKGQVSGFHVLRFDFQSERQSITTFRWKRTGAGDAYVREVGPIESVLGRNQRREAQPYRFHPTFEAKLEDPELAILHSKQGKLRLSDFYTYPDIKPINDEPGESKSRVKGENLIDVIGHAPRSLLFGPDRCGKTSLAKKLCMDIHALGNVPLLLHGTRMKNVQPDRLVALLEKLVAEQYEALTPEAYWQISMEKRVLIVDDLHHAPPDTDHRAGLLAEIERRFDRIVIIGADEFYHEELLCVDTEERKSHALWAYDLYRILPFGHLRCEQFVRNWVSLGQVNTNEVEEKVAQINGLLTQFLRDNLIPQYPWVVMIIVQLADSPEPLHAENGSYGYLLQALITAALAKSRLKLPINGKYAWLSELANALYKLDASALSDDDARNVHEHYRKEYGVPDLDYKEIRDDLASAGVLRLGGGEVAFRQPYTYCYFVAWHLAQRLHANDSTVRDEVRCLCKDLHHEDTANVLVFLAHLTTSHVVLEEMTARAAELFAESKETDFATDLEPINNLYTKVQALILPHGDPRANKLALQDRQDEQKAERDGKTLPKREVKLHSSEVARANREKTFDKIAELVTATRTIEILGQVLRNEATARKLPAMLEVTTHVFRLGRRLLGFLFSVGGQHLEKMICSLEEHYRHRMPKAKADDLVHEVSRHLFNLYTFTAFAVVKHVVFAVGDRNLREVFRQLVQGDPNLANRIYKLGIDLETAPNPPLQDVEDLTEELSGKTKIPGRPRTFNNVAHTVVRALVVDYLYLHHVPQKKVQALCDRLKIDVPKRVVDPTIKRLPPPKK